MSDLDKYTETLKDVSLDNQLKKILGEFVTGDIEEMPIEQIKQAFRDEGWYNKPNGESRNSTSQN